MKKEYILKKNFDIEKLIALKNTIGSKYFVIYYKKSNKKDEKVKIAISVSKKFGKAVKRNYQKRVIRELIYPSINKLNGYIMLIVAKPQIMMLDFEEKREQINYILKKILEKENTNEEK